MIKPFFDDIKNNPVKIRKPLQVILLISIIIISGGVLLSGCGGGGSSQSSVPYSNNNTMDVYLDKFSDMGTVNIPYVYVYINGNTTPIPLLLDTGATGIMINEWALPQGVTVTKSGKNFSGSFADNGTYSGYVGYANISTSPGGGLTADNIPVAIATTDTDFPSGSLLQGDFGMGISPYYSFGNINGSPTLYTPSFVSGLSDSNYNNGFILNFNTVGFNSDGYSIINSPNDVPAGTITFGLNTVSDNEILPGSIFYPNASGQTEPFPMIASEFGGYAADSEGYGFYSFFDTGSNYIYLGTGAEDYSISGFSQAGDVISSGPPQCINILYGGLYVDFDLYDSGGAPVSGAFTTAPNNPQNSFCDYQDYLNAAKSSGSSAVATDNAAFYSGGYPQGGQEDLGLPYIFDKPIYWQVQSQPSGWGVGIEQ